MCHITLEAKLWHLQRFNLLLFPCVFLGVGGGPEGHREPDVQLDPDVDQPAGEHGQERRQRRPREQRRQRRKQVQGGRQ